jgi:hypothetical protein
MNKQLHTRLSRGYMRQKDLSDITMKVHEQETTHSLKPAEIW